MRKLRLSLALCAGVLAVSVATAFGGPPAFDKAEGAGTFGGTCIIMFPGIGDLCNPPGLLQPRSFSFSAQQRGFGERATGVYTQERPLGSGRHFTARVTCLNVLGNTAVFGGILEEAPADFGGPVPFPFVIWVIDNGPAGSTPPDFISPMVIYPPGDPDRPEQPPAFPNVCPQPFPSLYGYFPLTSGNIVVEDESPPGRVSAG